MGNAQRICVFYFFNSPYAADRLDWVPAIINAFRVFGRYLEQFRRKKVYTYYSRDASVQKAARKLPMQVRRILLCVVAFIVCCVYLTRSRLRGWKLLTFGPDDSFDLRASVRAHLLLNVSEYDDVYSATSTSLGYLLAANIQQQITHAIDGYTGLASLASLLHLKSVEPYVCNTFLSTLPTLDNNGTPCAENLSIFYNMRSFRAMLDSCSPTNTHEMVTFERFLEQASREVVLVYIEHSLSYRLTGKFVELNKMYNVETPIELTELNRWASYVSKQKNMQSPEFRLSRVFLVDAKPKEPLHLQRILSVLGSVVRQQHSRSGSATILFHNWRGIHNIPDTKYFYYIPEYYRHCLSVHSLEDSQQVLETAKVFAHSIEDKESDTRNRIGVHVRGEKLIQKEKDKFVHCFDELDALLREMSSNTYGRMTVWMIHDLRKYGTVTCKFNDCTRLRPKFLLEVKKHGYNVTFFDPLKFPSVPQSPAFASFVERAYLSQMDVLITLGTGAYQDTIVADFLQQKQHMKQHLHRICH